MWPSNAWITTDYTEWICWHGRLNRYLKWNEPKFIFNAAIRIIKTISEWAKEWENWFSTEVNADSDRWLVRWQWWDVVAESRYHKWLNACSRSIQNYFKSGASEKRAVDESLEWTAECVVRASDSRRNERIEIDNSQRLWRVAMPPRLVWAADRASQRQDCNQSQDQVSRCIHSKEFLEELRPVP